MRENHTPKIWFTLLFGLGMGVTCLLLPMGCTTPWDTISTNVENSKQLRVGMTKAQVLEIMGNPLTEESFCKPDLWFYYLNTVWYDGLITEDECLPLVFEDGVLIGWGKPFYTQYRIDQRNRLKQTPKE